MVCLSTYVTLLINEEDKNKTKTTFHGKCLKIQKLNFDLEYLNDYRSDFIETKSGEKINALPFEQKNTKISVSVPKLQSYGQ